MRMPQHGKWGETEAQGMRGRSGLQHGYRDAFHPPLALRLAALWDNSSNFGNDPQSLGPTPEIL